jgi:small conductance mechanosensitive channel
MESITQWFVNNEAMLWSTGEKLLIAVVIFFIGYRVAKVIQRLCSALLLKKGVDGAAAEFVARILFLMLLTAVVVAALNQLGVETTSIVAMLGAAGLAIGLALKDSLSNFASGVLLIVLKPFRVGDFVETGGVTGTVETIELFSTTINTPDNRKNILPNAMVFGSVITNYTAHPRRRIDVIVGVSYTSDLKIARQAFERVLSNHEEIFDDPEPFIGVDALADSSVNFAIKAWVATENVIRIRSELLEQFKWELEASGVEIPFPQLDLHVQELPANNGTEVVK